MNADLELRIAALSQEIRHYPGPIARCDQHLAALLDERAQLVAWLRRREEAGACDPANTWADDGGAAA